MKLTQTLAVASVAMALALSLIGPADAQALEKKQVTLGVGGKGLLYYLPLTISVQKCYFKLQGLDL